MGYGSAGTPPWVDEEKIDEERKELKNAKNEAILKALQKENVALRKRVKQLEDELQRLKKQLFLFRKEQSIEKRS